MRRTAASFHLQYTLASGLVSGARRHPVQSYSDSRTLVRSASSPISPVLRGILSRRRACVAFRTHDSPTASLFASVLGFQGSTGTACMLSAPAATLALRHCRTSLRHPHKARRSVPLPMRRPFYAATAGLWQPLPTCVVPLTVPTRVGSASVPARLLAAAPLYILPLANAHRLLPLPFAHLPLAQDVSIGLQYIRLRHNNFVPVRRM
ncbi:hypothetical protein C8J57DRAFT_1402517, partial [Mycena rebaudengoi]